MPAVAADREEQLYWLALHQVPGLGPRRCLQLLERFGSPRAIFRASASELESQGIGPSAARSIASGCTFEDAATQQEKLLATGAEAIAYGDPRYPAQLQNLPDPPLILFARGRIELLQSVMVALVGTRRATAYGTAVATHFGRDLAGLGVTVVSGMARGIDTAAHRGTLEAGGMTVAVLGCGVDVVYPAENRKLAAEIIAKGLLISEFPMGTPAFPQNFPVRNRIVSGLSAGVVVIEGARYSGSAITARLAMDQGRELFAVPGNVTSKMSWGPNLLIQQGARLVQEAADIVEALPQPVRAQIAAGKQEVAKQQTLTPEIENPVAAAVLTRVPAGSPVQIDALLEDLPQYSSSELIAALFELEMLGLVRQLAGKNFIKVW